MLAGRLGAKSVVVVTGSSGFLGTALVDRLAERYRVIGLDVKEPRESSRCHFLFCDFTRDDSVAHAFSEIRKRYGTDIASTVHLAAYYDFSGEPSPLYQELTVQGTRRLTEHLQEFRCQQVVFSSTVLVHQPSLDGAIDEHSPLEAKWDYPRSKIRAERVLRANSKNIPVVILRIAGVYDDDCHSIPIAQQIRRVYERKLEGFVFPGNADHGQPFVHVNDVVEAFDKTIARRDALDKEEVFVIGEPRLSSYRELQDRIGRLVHGSAWPTMRIPKAMAKAGAFLKKQIPGSEQFIQPWMIDIADDHYPVDVRRAKERLGWVPRHSLEGTLPVMIERLLHDPAEWYRTNNLTPPSRESPESGATAEARSL